MTHNTHDCQWCGDSFTTLTAKGIHVHEQHPESIGRGPTKSATWSCYRCATSNLPAMTGCYKCGLVRS